MKKVTSPIYGFEITIVRNMVDLRLAVAEHIHKAAVYNNESIDTDWADTGYRAYLCNEAAVIIEDSKEDITNFIMKYKVCTPDMEQYIKEL